VSHRRTVKLHLYNLYLWWENGEQNINVVRIGTETTKYLL
jgi:hypothetical protein